MTKRFFSLLLVLAMLAAMIVLPVSATTLQSDAAAETVTDTKGECPCGCGQTLDAVKWKP